MGKNEKQVSNSGVGNHKASLELAGRGHDISALVKIIICQTHLLLR